MSTENAAARFRLETAAQEATESKAEVAGEILAALAAAQAAVEQIETVALCDPRLPNADKQLFSVGKACQLLGIAPKTLEWAMLSTGRSFVMTINEVGYLDGLALAAAAKFIRDERRAAAEASKQ